MVWGSVLTSLIYIPIRRFLQDLLWGQIYGGFWEGCDVDKFKTSSMPNILNDNHSKYLLNPHSVWNLALSVVCLEVALPSFSPQSSAFIIYMLWVRVGQKSKCMLLASWGYWNNFPTSLMTYSIFLTVSGAELWNPLSLCRPWGEMCSLTLSSFW